MIEILTLQEIELMKVAGRKAADCLLCLEDVIKPGITTFEIDAFVKRHCLGQCCVAAPLGYRGANGGLPPFPASCCTSINEVVCHGIPSSFRKLNDGDIINVDVTYIWQGYHGDTSKTFCVGNVSDVGKKLVDACQKALWAGIEQVRPGARLGDIGAAIQDVADNTGFSVVTDFVGHGIGRKFHCEPNVCHSGARGMGLRLKPGMCFTIEPMLNAGRPDVRVLDDKWTAITVDNMLSAQWEHTVLVTADGHFVLTGLNGNDSELLSESELLIT